MRYNPRLKEYYVFRYRYREMRKPKWGASQTIFGKDVLPPTILHEPGLIVVKAYNKKEAIGKVMFKKQTKFNPCPRYRRNPKRKFDVVNYILAYESGEISEKDILKLFAHLIKTGQVWQLQASVYGRPAKRLIELGYISPEGKILKRR